jgi:hypothetical protein
MYIHIYIYVYMSMYIYIYIYIYLYILYVYRGISTETNRVKLVNKEVTKEFIFKSEKLMLADKILFLAQVMMMMMFT